MTSAVHHFIQLPDPVAIFLFVLVVLLALALYFIYTRRRYDIRGVIPDILDASDNNALFRMFQVSERTIILPTPSPGLSITFVIEQNGPFDVTIKCPLGSDIFGHIQNASPDVSLAGAATDIMFNADECRPGDMIEFVGISSTRWMVQGRCAEDGAISWS